MRIVIGQIEVFLGVIFAVKMSVFLAVIFAMADRTAMTFRTNCLQTAGIALSQGSGYARISHYVSTHPNAVMVPTIAQTSVMKRNVWQKVQKLPEL